MEALEISRGERPRSIRTLWRFAHDFFRCEMLIPDQIKELFEHNMFVETLEYFFTEVDK